MIFGLIGNQNSGKTTLFNELTGSNQHVGNFPGVTVERKEGIIRGQKNVSVVDLPGIYSLSPYTPEEVVTRDFLLRDRPDAIINIIDATNIERNLYLTMQLIELGIPMVLALNMMDEVRQNGGSILIQKFQDELGVPAVPISAMKNEGITELVERAINIAQNRTAPKRLDFCSGSVHRAIHSIAHAVEDHAANMNIPVRFAATKLVEGDKPMFELLKLSDNEVDLIGHIVQEMEQEMDTDREAALADMRYTYIEGLCAKTVVKKQESQEYQRSVKIDNVLTHKYFALPIFLLIMFTIFWLTFGVIGTALSDAFSSGVDYVIGVVSDLLLAANVNSAIHGLIVDGALAGVGSVLSFLPVIIILFFFLSLLEDSGYMARVAFVVDKLLRKIGLSGRSFVPMLIGFGCTVPAIMATRTLASERDRKMTILLTPFMSCSAKLPIYAVFTAAFFSENQALVMITLYVLGMLLAVLTGLALKNTLFQGNPVPFVMELPSYRMPTMKSVARLLWDKAMDFIVRAFTIIFVATILIWLLQTFDFRFNMVEDSSTSMMAQIARLIAPIFAPLGFGDWKAATALITGFTAKEAVVSTLAVLTGASVDTLPSVLSQMFSPLTAFSFLVFTLLYTPCVAAVAAVKREMGSATQAFYVVLYQLGVAWAASFVVYNLGRLMGF